MSNPTKIIEREGFTLRRIEESVTISLIDGVGEHRADMAVEEGTIVITMNKRFARDLASQCLTVLTSLGGAVTAIASRFMTFMTYLALITAEDPKHTLKEADEFLAKYDKERKELIRASLERAGLSDLFDLSGGSGA